MPKGKRFFTINNELWKLCNHCNRLLPYNILYFCKNPKQPTGLSYVCKICETRRIRLYTKKRKEEGYIPPDKKRMSQPGPLKKRENERKLKMEIADLFEISRKEEKKDEKEEKKDE